nr:MAG TPA: hypothetical protein [Caudoviricetes sp.]
MGLIPPPSEKRPAAAVCYSWGSKTFQQFPRLRVAALRVGARIAGQFQNKLRLCGAGVLRTYSFPFFFPLGWAARPPVPQNRRRRCPNRAREVTLCESRTGRWRS